MWALRATSQMLIEYMNKHFEGNEAALIVPDSRFLEGSLWRTRVSTGLYKVATYYRLAAESMAMALITAESLGITPMMVSERLSVACRCSARHRLARVALGARQVAGQHREQAGAAGELGTSAVVAGGVGQRAERRQVGPLFGAPAQQVKRALACVEQPTVQRGARALVTLREQRQRGRGSSRGLRSRSRGWTPGEGAARRSGRVTIPSASTAA
jgi:hypothetical protein